MHSWPAFLQGVRYEIRPIPFLPQITGVDTDEARSRAKLAASKVKPVAG